MVEDDSKLLTVEKAGMVFIGKVFWGTAETHVLSRQTADPADKARVIDSVLSAWREGRKVCPRW